MKHILSLLEEICLPNFIISTEQKEFPLNYLYDASGQLVGDFRYSTKHPTWHGYLGNELAFTYDLPEVAIKFFNQKKVEFLDLLAEKINQIDKPVLLTTIIRYKSRVLKTTLVDDRWFHLALGEAEPIYENLKFEYSVYSDLTTNDTYLKGIFSQYFKESLTFLRSLEILIDKIESPSVQRRVAPAADMEQNNWHEFDERKVSLLRQINEFLIEKKGLIDEEYASSFCELLNSNRINTVIRWNGSRRELHALIDGLGSNQCFKNGSQPWKYFKGKFEYQSKDGIWKSTADTDLRKSSGYDTSSPPYKQILRWASSLR